MISSARDDFMRVRLKPVLPTSCDCLVTLVLGKQKYECHFSAASSAQKKRLPNLSVEYAFPTREHQEEYYELLREHGNVYVYDID